MQANLQILEGTNEVTESGPREKRPDLSLQIPPRPVSLYNSRSGKGLFQSQGPMKGNSPSTGFLRGLSFKKKVTLPDGEKSSLLNSDSKPTTESPRLANLMNVFAWKRCTSLPVSHASNLSPSVPTPNSARMYDERSRSQVSALILFVLCRFRELIKFLFESQTINTLMEG